MIGSATVDFRMSLDLCYLFLMACCERWSLCYIFDDGVDKQWCPEAECRHMLEAAPNR